MFLCPGRLPDDMIAFLRLDLDDEVALGGGGDGWFCSKLRYYHIHTSSLTLGAISCFLSTAQLLCHQDQGKYFFSCSLVEGGSGGEDNFHLFPDFIKNDVSMLLLSFSTNI